jgi:hypothetical protein
LGIEYVKVYLVEQKQSESESLDVICNYLRLYT